MTDDAALDEACIGWYGSAERWREECTPQMRNLVRRKMRAAIEAYLAARGDAHREALQEGRDHLTVSGTFQSDRYPTVPAGKVPLSVRDSLAQDLLWEYARRHREAAKHGDSEFPRDLEEALRNAGFEPAAHDAAQLAERRADHPCPYCNPSYRRKILGDPAEGVTLPTGEETW